MTLLHLLHLSGAKVEQAERSTCSTTTPIGWRGVVEQSRGFQVEWSKWKSINPSVYDRAVISTGPLSANRL